jgi:hypothetical protein
MKLDHPLGATSAIGFEKAFVHYPNKTISRLNFIWNSPNVGVFDLWPPGSCISAQSQDHPTTCNGARLPKFDEETGRIVQDSRDGVWVIDTTLYRR